MLPAEIKAEQFNGYPPQARQVAINHIELFRQLPLAFAPLILQQLEQYDWKFPAERREIDHQLSYLSSRSTPEMTGLLSEFERLKLSRQLEQFNWVDAPGTFSQQLSAYLWATHQIDSFRGAAEKLMEKVNASMPSEPLPAPRLGIVVVGKGVKESQYPLFRKLRPYGTRFTRVNPSNGLRILLAAAAARAKAHPVPFGHWYVDGGPAEALSETAVISISYSALEPVRKAILQKITRAINGGIGGPEALTSMLFKLRPEQVGLSGKPEDEIIGHLETSIFTQGQGTQIFSTTFVQWTAREVLRRAHPLTLVARFAPRQRQRPMNELLSGKDTNPEPDPIGSLIDADMGAFLTWIDQQRLSGANQSSFLAWFEDHHEAVAVSPFLPHNTESDTAIDMTGLLNQMGLKTALNREVPQREATQSSSLNPAHDNYVLEGVDNNLDSVDFLNGANYGHNT